jgi:hypothetical protein
MDTDTVIAINTLDGLIAVRNQEIKAFSIARDLLKGALATQLTDLEKAKIDIEALKVQFADAQSKAAAPQLAEAQPEPAVSEPGVV